ncbi:DUF2637 domain-containing protein [Streptomyces sp. ITFR-6]|uniref:DUF2637 domain-containing protein n=1 Tax=Streptomyces sp. ITFR-6 TaxID=3075197 RepID=UPI00288A6AA9|nr:DUF2637 domain-containing protein [Streptomyces sp. ITFR-6]WNI30392.1 DUF2637 domain-containing protein [Streptomyces sp. ITFR-6]
MTTPATPHDTPRHTQATPRAQGTKRQATPQHAAERYALAAAGTVIIALTAGGFWLSYAHLAQVAGQHGLGSSPIRQWAWPATLDAFIVAGELLMLRSGLRRVTDWWAVTLTAIGSAGSIALNVAGVSGTGNESVAPLLDYVVAAVPPTAALLAFGVLMRQIHQLVDQASDRPATGSGETPESPALPPAHTGQPRTAASGYPNTPLGISKGVPRGGRPVSATVEELVEIGRIAAAEKRKLTRDIVQQAIREKGHTVGGQRLTEVMEILRSEPGADRNVG